MNHNTTIVLTNGWTFLIWYNKGCVCYYKFIESDNSLIEMWQAIICTNKMLMQLRVFCSSFVLETFPICTRTIYNNFHLILHDLHLTNLFHSPLMSEINLMRSHYMCIKVESLGGVVVLLVDFFHLPSNSLLVFMIQILSI